MVLEQSLFKNIQACREIQHGEEGDSVCKDIGSPGTGLRFSASSPKEAPTAHVRSRSAP